PASRFVADFIGETNWFAGEVASTSPGGLVMNTGIGSFHSAAGGAEFKAGQPVWVGFRPEAVRLGPDERNRLVTTIRHVSYLGEIEQYELGMPPLPSAKVVDPLARPGASPISKPAADEKLPAFSVPGAVAEDLCLKAFEQNPVEIRRVGETLVVHVPPRDVLVLPAG